MNKIIKGWIILFSLLTAVTILGKIIHFKGWVSIICILIAIAANLAVFLLAYFLIKLSKNKKYIFIISLLVSVFAGLYLASEYTYIGYANYLSIAGVLFIIGVSKISGTFWIVPPVLLILIALSIFKAVNSKFKKKQKININIIFAGLLILILIFLTIPQKVLNNSSPVTNLLAFKYKIPEPNNQENTLEQNIILNISSTLSKPNIIIIMLEAVSKEHIHYYGYERNLTPNIDSLMQKSIVFNNAYSSAVHTEYSQTAFLSSRYPLKSKYRDNFQTEYPREFIWDILKKQGYNTSYFTSQDDNWLEIISYWNLTNLDAYSTSLTDGKFDYEAAGKKDDDVKTTEKALEFLNNSSYPFFLYVNLQATHYKYYHPENISIFLPEEAPTSAGLFQKVSEENYPAFRNKYDNSLYYVDMQVGRIIKYLEQNTLMNNTIIILTADHGEPVSQKHGFNLHGLNIYQENVKVPLAFFIPSVNHQEINENVKHIDVVPTILNISGFSLSQKFQGKVMKTNSDIFFITQTQRFAIGLIRDEIKYIINIDNGFINEAYNLTQDAEELNNLIPENSPVPDYLIPYRDSLVSWYFCQLDYYQKDGYKLNDTISC